MTEYLVSVDCHLAPTIPLKFRPLTLMSTYVVHQLFTQPKPLLPTVKDIPNWAPCMLLILILCSDLGFLLDGQLYHNNSVVTVTDIGSSFFMSALFCLTPSLECCSNSETPYAASVTREWYLPDGRPVTSDNSLFIKNRVSSAVSLHHDLFSSNTAPSGVYRCEIPDANGTSQNIYVGIYPQGDGEIDQYDLFIIHILIV